jgi:hypothetical protein
MDALLVDGLPHARGVTRLTQQFVDFGWWVVSRGGRAGQQESAEGYGDDCHDAHA